MGRSWTPSIVPNGADQNVYLVVDCDGRGMECVWREAAVGSTDIETVIADLITGQYSDPARIVAFNVAERWCEDVSADVARELRHRADIANEDLSSSIEDFVNRHAGRDQQLTLRLA